MNDAPEFWDGKNRALMHRPDLLRPTVLAYGALGLVPAGSRVLDLGSGRGRDSLLFAEAGMRVTAMDFSAVALAALPEGVEAVKHSIADVPYPLPPASYDMVYARLSLHYFDVDTTHEVFGEIHRLLRPQGLLVALVNSIDDAEYGTGRLIGPDYYELEPGDRKRYFSCDALYGFAARWFTVRLAEQTAEDALDPFGPLVRLVAERP
ncbi:class I SAM-dependent methyltransferase [Sphaerisporangium sp. B11E5]|uniref:class I SAM-dependent methyltransferase n=1 Tax=Sphaerisporangium sp. B11E5 TaxID=3153563 RepID=UPI00325F7223